MTTIDRPRRYVRVRMLTHDGTLASWSCRLCITVAGYWTAEVAHDHATKHARECEAIRIATERDQLAREVHQLRQELTDRRLITYDTRAELIAARAERDQLRAQLDTTRHLLWAALGAITERDET